MRPQPLGPGPGGREAPASRHPFSLRDGAGTPWAEQKTTRRRAVKDLYFDSSQVDNLPK